MKRSDYRKLVATGRKSIRYARPGENDDALIGIIWLGFVSSLILTLGIAVLASSLGGTLESAVLVWSLGATVIPGVAFFVCGLFIGDAPRYIRYCIIVIGASVGIALTYSAIVAELSGWYLYVPSFLYVACVSVRAFRQL